MEYIKVSEAAAKWGISARRVRTLCAEGRIAGAVRKGNLYMIPSDALQPSDARTVPVRKKKQAYLSLLASIDTLTDAGFGGKLKPFKKYIKRFERKANGNLADCCSVDALRATDTKALLIHSRDDQMADISTGLDYVRSRISNPNVKYLEVEGKFHNPNYTEDAVAYMRQTFGEYEALVKSKKLRTLEQKKAYMADKGFLRMTEQDGKIWDKIFSHMEKAL